MRMATRRQLDGRRSSVRQQLELAVAARHAAAQDMTDEWQMYCVLSGVIGAAMRLSRMPSEFAAATWHAGQAVITKRRIYDLLDRLLEAGPGHVFSTAVVTEQASVLPRCRHCRASARSIAARRPCPGDAHQCARSVRPGRVPGHHRGHLLAAAGGLSVMPIYLAARGAQNSGNVSPRAVCGGGELVVVTMAG
jgi:hypothetical protein